MPQIAQDKMLRFTHGVVKAAGALLTVLAIAGLIGLIVSLAIPQTLEPLFMRGGSGATGSLPASPLLFYFFSLCLQFSLAALALRILTGVIETMRSDGPFKEANISRLKQLGWLAIAISASGILFSMAKNSLFESSDYLAAPLEFDIAGPILALTFFVIAHAFSVGLTYKQELDEFV